MNLFLDTILLHSLLIVASGRDITSSPIISMEVDRFTLASANVLPMDWSDESDREHVLPVESVFKMAFERVQRSCHFQHSVRLDWEISSDLSPNVLATANAWFQEDPTRKCWLPFAHFNDSAMGTRAAMKIRVNKNLLHMMIWPTECDETHSWPSQSRYDLVTIIMHEIVHGIAAYDSITSVRNNRVQHIGMNSNRSKCSPCEAGCMPTCFDAAIVTNSGQKIADLCEINPWIDLQIGDVKLFQQTAGEWNIGTGLSHVRDEQSLMYPGINMGKCMRNLDSDAITIVNAVANAPICVAVDNRFRANEKFHSSASNVFIGKSAIFLNILFGTSLWFIYRL